MDTFAVLTSVLGSGSRVRYTAAAIVGALILITVVAALLERPNRLPMFAVALHPEQLTEVEQQLALWNVPFTPSADNVLVDKSRRNALLLRLSLAGVPHTHVDSSADLLGKVGALTPQSVIDAQTRDGLADDIQLALRGIQGVEDARVIIAPAKGGYFADEPSQEATASVRVRLMSGAHLPSGAVSGIRGFVAAAVPGLDARNVTILDDRGIALTEGGDVADESSLQRSLQSALDATLGAGTALVRVHVDYDTRSITTHDVRHTPAASDGIAVERQDERYRAPGKQYSRSAAKIERATDAQEVTSSTRPGQIARISAAVFVDARAVTNLADIRTLAAATLGIEPRRGDTLQVESLPFRTAAPPHHNARWLAYGALVPAIPAAITAITLLAAIRLSAPLVGPLLRSWTEHTRSIRTAKTVQGIAPAQVHGVLAHEPAHTAAAIISALPAATAAAVLDMYPEHERAAIVRRMQRPLSPLVPNPEEFITHA